MPMRCKKCGSVLIRKEDDNLAKKAAEGLGLPFGGSYICLKCYPKYNETNKA